MRDLMVSVLVHVYETMKGKNRLRSFIESQKPPWSLFLPSDEVDTVMAHAGSLDAVSVELTQIVGTCPLGVALFVAN